MPCPHPDPQSDSQSGPHRGPPGDPRTGHLDAYRKNLLGFLLQLARDYRPIARYRLHRQPMFLVSDPALIAEPLLKNPRAYLKNRFVWRHNERFLGDGLLTSEGEIWRRKRLIHAKAFQPQHLPAYAAVMQAFTAEQLRSWQDGETRDLHREMMKLTARVVARTLLGVDFADADDRIVNAMDAVMRELPPRTTRRHPLPDWIPTAANRRWNAAIDTLDAAVHGFIDAHLARSARGDTGDTLLAILIASRDEDGRPMTRKQLRDDILTLFFAGHETTAAGLSWTLYLLSQHPEVLARMRAELDAVTGGRPPMLDDLPKLAFAAQVVRESHRLYPPVYLIGRTPKADIELGVGVIPKGAVLQLSAWVLHRDPVNFPDPERFDPDRWTPDFERTLPRFAYLPFGGGPRTCIGERFAQMESLLVLAAIIRDWDFDYARDQPPRPQVSLTLKPAGGLPMRLRRR